jgi:mannose-6-phosphate isomerase-like protein (cupin superfamily)
MSCKGAKREYNMMQYDLTGLSIADTRHPIETHAQLGGAGIVYNKALAIPVHIGRPWNSIEFVSIPPGENGVGKHTQGTDEIYLLVEGTGELVTNDAPRTVSEGLLVIAPKGTTHEIRNTSNEQWLSFLVVELLSPEGADIYPPTFLDLYKNLLQSQFHTVTPGQQLFQPLVANVDLSRYFAADWGMLSLLSLPAGATVEEFVEPECDQLIFGVCGFPTIHITVSEDPHEELRIDGDDGYHQSVVVPRGVPHRITNRASGDYPLKVVCLNVRRAETVGRTQPLMIGESAIR